MENIIEIRDLTFHYQPRMRAAICNLNCNIPYGEIIAIVGKSGIGKSTLLRLISGIYRKSDPWNGPYHGEISISGREPYQLKGPKEVSMMAQTPFLMDHLTVRENILLPCDLTSEGESTTSKCYNELMECLGLVHEQDRKPTELSGGMKTRVALARAMICSPKHLFLDEPFTSLDIIRRWVMYKAIRKGRALDKLCTILTTHDLWEAVILGNYIAVLDERNGTSTIDLQANSFPEIESNSIQECLQVIHSKVEDITHLLEGSLRD